MLQGQAVDLLDGLHAVGILGRGGEPVLRYATYGREVRKLTDSL